MQPPKKYKFVLNVIKEQLCVVVRLYANIVKMVYVHVKMDFLYNDAKNIRDLCKEAFHCANCKLAADCSLIAFQKKQEEIDKDKKIAADAKSEEVPAVKKSAYAYVDGSYNQNTSTYGYGGYLVDEQGNGHLLQGSGCDPEMASMRNVSGEILGAKRP